MLLSEVLRLGYPQGTPTVCGKRGRQYLEDLFEVDALRARQPSFRAGPNLTSPQLEIMSAARYLVYGSQRTPTVWHGTGATPSPPSSIAEAAEAEAETEATGAGSSTPTSTPPPAAAINEGTLSAAAADTATQLMDGALYSTHPLTEHPKYALSFSGVNPSFVPDTAEQTSHFEQQYVPLYTAQQLQNAQLPLIASGHLYSHPHSHHQLLQQKGLHLYHQQQQQQQRQQQQQQQTEYCCYYYHHQQQQVGYCYSQQQQEQQHDGYYYQQLEYCHQQQQLQQLVAQGVVPEYQAYPAAHTTDLMLLQQQQAQQQVFYPQFQQQQQNPFVMYNPSNMQHALPWQAPSSHLPPSFQQPSRGLPPPLQPVGGPAVLDSDDLQVGLSEYHSDDQDDVISEGDDIIDDGISDNGTELGSEFDSEPENLVDRADEGANGDEPQPEGPGFEFEGMSDFEDAVDDYGTTEEEEENNSVPPADLEAILAENARLWGQLVAQGGQGLAA